MNSYKYGLLAAVCCVFAQPALADEAKTSGFRVEARLGVETPTVSYDGDTYKFGTAASFGGEVGYDIPVSSSVTVGPFANYEYARAKDCGASYDGEYFYDSCVGSNGNLAVGARVGLNVGERVQVYGKLAYDRLTMKANVAGGHFSGSSTANFDGVQGALGADLNLSNSTYVGVEFSYAGLGKLYGANLARRHAALTAGLRF